MRGKGGDFDLQPGILTRLHPDGTCEFQVEEVRGKVSGQFHLADFFDASWTENGAEHHLTLGRAPSLHVLTLLIQHPNSTVVRKNVQVPIKRED